jgi:Rieske Fe-S protein
VAWQHKGTWVATGDWKHLRIGTPTTLRVGQGVFYATLRAGQPLSVVSGSCPLDGATVQWDTKAKQFVCPQDGSAFSVEGVVIHGPEGKPLSKPEWKWQGESLLVRLSKR